jgi:antitoxin (DNA-binding transcriptional repressor) of toxin-antitoxin stability system
MTTRSVAEAKNRLSELIDRALNGEPVVITRHGRPRAAQQAAIAAADVTAATAFLRRLDLNLRTPDALNLPIAQRIGPAIATFDQRMAASAAALGTPVAPA